MKQEYMTFDGSSQLNSLSSMNTCHLPEPQEVNIEDMQRGGLVHTTPAAHLRCAFLG